MSTENQTESVLPSGGITLHFNMSSEDIFAMAWEYNRTSKTFRRARTRARYLVPVIYVLLWLFICYSEGFHWPLTVVFLGVALLWWLFNPLWVNRRARRYVRKALSEDKRATYFGAYTLTLSADALYSKGPIGEGSYHWTAVERLVQTDTHLFIFLPAGSGWSVPIAEVGEQAAQEAYAYGCARQRTA